MVLFIPVKRHNVPPFPYRTSITVLYVFVDIQIDPKHLIDTMKLNFDKSKKMAVVSTIQFLNTLHRSECGRLLILSFDFELPYLHFAFLSRYNLNFLCLNLIYFTLFRFLFFNSFNVEKLYDGFLLK